MIRSFRHKGLAELFKSGRSRNVRPDQIERVWQRINVLHRATKLEELNVPGWSLHALKGESAGRHAIKVNGPWRLTFEFKGGDVHEVDLEQYH